jgi:hypothetical protein
MFMHLMVAVDFPTGWHRLARSQTKEIDARLVIELSKTSGVRLVKEPISFNRRVTASTLMELSDYRDQPS